ncbi:MAG TPA: exonuclease domain-containing protein [Thermodesulfobacteriota bacterium]
MANTLIDSQLNTLLPLEAEYVFTDIETESLAGLLLLQIAAITLTGLQFNVFINPFRPLSEDCSKLLGFYYYNNQLFRNGRKLQTSTIKQALLDFTAFIANIKKPVVLVYHNGFAFDCSILANYLIRFNIPIPSNLITVCDSLPFFRNFFKDKNIANHKLGTLASHYNITHEHAHCALSDSKVLRDICEKIRIQNSFTFQQMFKNSFRKFSDYVDRITKGKPLTPLIKEKKPKKTKPKTQKQ